MTEFLGVEELEKEIFCHFSDINSTGFKYLDVNDEVVFNVIENNDVYKALNINKIV